MLPIALDIAAWPIIAAGRGPALHKRLELLAGSGAGDVTVYAPDAADQAVAWPVLPRLPTGGEIAAARVLLAAGLTPAEEASLGAAARAHRVLLNIEDRLPWCDFHVPALVRRGDLLLTVSTNGRSPAVASALRQWLGRMFDDSWAARLDEAAALRTRLRAEGATPAEVIAATRPLALRWLPPG